MQTTLIILLSLSAPANVVLVVYLFKLRRQLAYLQEMFNESID